MEEMRLDTDINVCCVTATSFPEGILEAHKQLHQMFPPGKGRKYFGLSRPEKGSIVYKAAAEELEAGEAGKLQIDSLVIKKGKYIHVTIEDFMKDLQSIERGFKHLLTHPGLDPYGYCVEWYLNDSDVKCMIRLQE